MNKMNYDKFKKWIVSNIRNYLPEDYMDAEIRINRVPKTNGIVKDALIITFPDTVMCPMLYLNDFYEYYRRGAILEDVVRKMVEVRMESRPPVNFSPELFEDYSRARERVALRLINTENNAGYLTDHPHTDIEDLSAVYLIMLGDDSPDLAGVQITNDLLAVYGVTVEQLHEDALRNMSRLTPGEFMNNRDFMINMIFPEVMKACGGDIEEAAMEINRIVPPSDTPMYIITNSRKSCGAASLLDPDFMDRVAETIGRQFYIIPSSVHEVMAVPFSDDIDPEHLEEIVQEVNEKHVETGEKLSDHIYTYDMDHHRPCLWNAVS